MNVRMFVTLTVVCFVSTVSLATPVVVVGSHDLQEDTAGQWITIAISGGDAVGGSDFNAQVADGFSGPTITDVDLETGIFAGNNQGQDDNGSIPQLAMYSILTSSGTVTGTGQLVRLEIDTTGFFDGESFDLKLGDTLNGSTTILDNIGSPIAGTSITNGLINIIPEPMSLSLLACGGIALLRRRRK